MDQSYSARLDPAPSPAASPACDAAAIVAAHLDAAFYLARYGDVRAAGLPAAQHFCDTGWREGRDPTDWFDTGYYLRAHPDIRAAGVNPFWHYLVQGHREARLPAPPGRRWRSELAAARPAAAGPAIDLPPPDAPRLDKAALADALAAATAGRRGLVLALSHDRYPENPGGTQLLIADEQRKFNGDGVTYLHLSPTAPRLGLAPPEAAVAFAVVLDGQVLGVADRAALLAALAGLAQPAARLLAVHNLHGHRPEDAAELARALRPGKAVFWAHDYGAGCPSPRLMRNDIVFCGAPPPDSMACRICVHGAERLAQRARLRALFAAVPFVLAAPSETALHWWQRGAALPLAGCVVHPHVVLAETEAPAPARAGPVRVAFVGHAAFHKGWGLFRELAVAARDLGLYQFFQLASPGALRPHDGTAAIPATATPDAPYRMAKALADQGIDLLLALSPWPETFGYVPHEALLAGADVVTIAAGGHVPAMLRARGQGVVLDDGAALLDWFVSGAAARHAVARRAAPPKAVAACHAGSTATLGDGPRLTDDPDLHLLVDGARLDGAPLDAAPLDTERLDGRRSWRFTLPAPPPRQVRLRSRHVRPVWDRLDGADLRRLGVAVTALALDDAAVPPERLAGRPGWHAPEPGWTWTDGDAALDCGAARTLTVELLPLAQYWRASVLAA